jgi:hypothetical protein
LPALREGYFAETHDGCTLGGILYRGREKMDRREIENDESIEMSLLFRVTSPSSGDGREVAFETASPK